MIKPLKFAIQITDKVARDKVLHNRITNKTIKWTKHKMMKMGTAYIKIGQLISSRSDIFPKEVIKEFVDFQNNADVEDIPYDKELVTLYDNPISVGSIGQVYTGMYKDTRPVVVKLKKESAKYVVDDMSAIMQFLQTMCIIFPSRQMKDVKLMIENLNVMIEDELDFENEYNNMIFMEKTFKDSDLIKIPKAIYANQDIIIMEHVPSIQRIPEYLINDLYYEVLEHAMQNNYIHGDLHAGNMGYLQNESKIVLYDFGVILTVPVDKLKKIFNAIVSNDAQLLVKFLVQEEFVYVNNDDSEQQLLHVTECILRYIQHMNIQRLFLELKSNMNESNDILFSINPDLCMLFRTLTLFEGVCKQYSSFSYNVIMIQLAMQYVPADVFIHKGFKDLLGMISHWNLE